RDNRRLLAGLRARVGRGVARVRVGFAGRIVPGAEAQQAVERIDEALLLAAGGGAALRCGRAQIVERARDLAFGLIGLAFSRERKRVLVARRILLETRVQRVDAGIVDLRR